MGKENETQKATDGPIPSGTFMDVQKSGFGNLMDLNAAWIENLGDINSEFLSFVAGRVQENVKTQQKILHCQDVAEVQKVQAESLQTAIDQYRAETGKIGELGMSTFKQYDALKL